MGRCSMCGKSGLFLKIDKSGLCKDCSLAEERRKNAGITEAKAFIEKISVAFSDILNSGGRLSGYSSFLDTENVPGDSVDRLLDDCSFIRSEFPRWKEYPFFEEALLSDCIPDPKIRGYFKHPCIPLNLLHSVDSSLDNCLDEKISDLLKNVNTLHTSLYLYGKYEYKTCRVAGVSFRNDDGSYRQELLRKIRYRGAPYQVDPTIRLEKVQYEEKDAVAVYANDNQIGWVSEFDLSSILPRFDRYKDVDEFSMHGGGSGGKKYGIDIRVRFYKEC